MSNEEVDYEEDVEMKDTQTMQVSMGGGKKGPGAAEGGRTVTMTSKGRGHDADKNEGNRFEGRGGVFEKLQRGGGAAAGPLQCKCMI
jgi:hypothetical protein